MARFGAHSREEILYPTENWENQLRMTDPESVGQHSSTSIYAEIRSQRTD